MRIRAGVAAQCNRATSRRPRPGAAGFVQPGARDRPDGDRRIGDLRQELVAREHPNQRQSFFPLDARGVGRGRFSAGTPDDRRVTGMDSTSMDGWLKQLLFTLIMHNQWRARYVRIPVTLAEVGVLQ